jgi:hypothetical protein
MTRYVPVTSTASVIIQQQVLIYCHKVTVCVTPLLKKPHLLTWLDSNFHLLLPKTLNVTDRADAATEITQKVKHFYFGNKTLSMETLSNYVEVS